MGNGHDGVLRTHYADSEYARCITQRGEVAFDEVAQLIEGTHPDPIAQALVNGGKHPDLESWEGTRRYAATWTYVGAKQLYDARKIAYCYRLDGQGRLILQEIPGFCNLELEIERAQECREEVFNTIHSPTIEGPEVLLARALHLAYEEGKLTKDFFFMSDERATQVLETKCGARVRKLVERTQFGNHYPRVYERSFRVPSGDQKALLQDVRNRQVFADTVAQEVGIPREHVCVHLCRYKGYKDYRGMNILRASGEPINVPHFEPFWRASAYVAPEHEHKAKAVAEVLDSLLLLR